MQTIRADIEIRVPAERVWEILTDLDSYPEWNPFITKISGNLVGGERLHVRIEPPGGKPMEFRPVLTRVHENKGITWNGTLWIAGLFDGEHMFTIEEINVDRVRFIQSENFSGLFIPFTFEKIQLRTREGFEKMNIALKNRAESDIEVRSEKV